MAKITMTGGFTVCPEGTHVFRIYEVEYDPDFGKIVVSMVNAQGIVQRERFTLINADNEPNEGACNAFSIFAKNALNNFGLEEIDHTDLIGKYIKCEIIHTTSPSKKDPTKTVVFANTGNKFPAEGFDAAPCKRTLELCKKLDGNVQTTEPTVAPAEGSLDLNSLLN